MEKKLFVEKWSKEFIATFDREIGDSFRRVANSRRRGYKRLLKREAESTFKPEYVPSPTGYKSPFLKPESIETRRKLDEAVYLFRPIGLKGEEGKGVILRIRRIFNARVIVLFEDGRIVEGKIENIVFLF